MMVLNSRLFKRVDFFNTSIKRTTTNFTTIEKQIIGCGVVCVICNNIALYFAIKSSIKKINM